MSELASEVEADHETELETVLETELDIEIEAIIVRDTRIVLARDLSTALALSRVVGVSLMYKKL